MEKIYLGTELKLNINIEPIDGVSMSSYNWEAELYCNTRKVVKIPKSSAKKKDNNNYIIMLDTNEVGVGALRCRITAQIPDTDFADKLRTEVTVINTDINIVQPI